MPVTPVPDPVAAKPAARTANFIRDAVISAEEPRGPAPDDLRSLQLLASPGMPRDILSGRFPRQARPLRRDDRPPQTHRRPITRRIVRQHTVAVRT